MNRETGSIQSHPDYRDLIARAVMAPAGIQPLADLPEMFRTDLGERLDQNLIPACVSHDVVYLIRKYWYEKTGIWIDLSPRFLDIMVKRIDGLDRETDGTYPRMVLKLAQTIGCCTTKLLPNNTKLSTLEYRNDALITAKMLEEAEQYKIPGYVNIATDPVSTRNGVYLYGATSALFQIDEQFYRPTWDTKDIDPIRTPKKVESGHQLAIIGWDSAQFNLGTNEWGVEWNMRGDFHYDPKAWRKYILEQWAIAEVPHDLKAFLSKLPSPTNFHYQWTNNLKRGDHNNDVGMAQVALMILGYLKPITPDEFGYFGGKTAQAVYSFQISNGVWPPSPDNIGQLTRGALNKKFA